MPNSIVAEMQAQQWAMEPAALKAFIEQLAGLPASAALTSIVVAKQPKQLQIVGGKAVIPINGVLLKTVPSWIRFFGIEATGYDEIRSQIKQALADDKVEKIHLQVDSPGGQVAGKIETADDIFNAREQKPVTASIEDIGASAAYGLTSQAQTIEAGRNAMVGSIGVFAVYVDSSKRAEELGFKVHVIKSGEHKGMGISGVEISEDQIKSIQKLIDAQADNFISSVATGRGMEKKEISALATGELWIAKTAQKLGLIDKVTVKTVPKNKSGNLKGQSMNKDQQNNEAAEEITQAEVTAAVQQATADGQKQMAELQEAFADDLDFALEAFGKGLTVDQAKAEYCVILQQRIAEASAKMVKREVTNKVEKVVGAKAIANDGSNNEATGDFLLEARAMVDEGKAKTVTEAMRKVKRQNPELHEAFKARCRAEGPEVFNQV